MEFFFCDQSPILGEIIHEICILKVYTLHRPCGIDIVKKKKNFSCFLKIVKKVFFFRSAAERKKLEPAGRENDPEGDTKTDNDSENHDKKRKIAEMDDDDNDDKAVKKFNLRSTCVNVKNIKMSLPEVIDAEKDESLQIDADDDDLIDEDDIIEVDPDDVDDDYKIDKKDDSVLIDEDDIKDEDNISDVEEIIEEGPDDVAESKPAAECKILCTICDGKFFSHEIMDHFCD